MSDPIFAEVDEEVRKEQLKKLWERYGTLIIAFAFVVVLGVAGWRGYQWWEARQQAQAGAAFEQAMLLAQQGKAKEAQAEFAKLAADGPDGYRMLARFHEAAAVAKSDPKAAISRYEALASDGSVPQSLQDLARLRAGMLLMDKSPYDEVLKQLEPLTGSGRTFRHTARELLAFAAWRDGKAAAAKHWIDLIITDAETPVGTRARINMLMALTGAETGKG